MNKKEIIRRAKNMVGKKSAWARGLRKYIDELMEDMSRESREILITRARRGEFCKAEEILLGGAADWTSYSYGGCSLIYDGDVCKRLATKSEQRRTRNGQLPPNAW